MKKILKNLFFIFLFFHFSLFAFYLEKVEIESFNGGVGSVKRLDITDFFHKINISFDKEMIITNVFALQEAAKDALKAFNEQTLKNKKVTKPLIFDKKIVRSKKVKETLKFIISVIDKDKKNKRKFRILDPEFLNKNFNFIKWSGDAKSAYENNVVISDGKYKGKIPPGKIRLTSYAVFKIDGSYNRTKKFCYALYKIINKKFTKKDRFKYTKQNVLSGILNRKGFKHKVKPLVWLTRDGLEEALMQGTAVVRMPDKRELVFNVDKNNGFVYDKKIKDKKEQKRYWYFRRLKYSNFKKGRSGVIFAGDLYNIGLGKIILIRYKNPITRRKEIRLGVLADCGGAFTNNLYQLDLFAGVFKSKWRFKLWLSQLPNTSEAYILVKK
ncbi:hypothetical protein KAT08_00430 [Candidatus Babeliales bacterium]|nr:hypothetical protein [Candidatus Babeliales bacterium]